MPQQTKLRRPLWLHHKQVSLPPPSKRCFSPLSLRHYSNTSTKHHPMWRMLCPSITRLSFRQPSLHLTPRYLSLTTTIWILRRIPSLPHRKTQGWHPNSQWHRQLLYPIHRELTSIIMPQSLPPGSLVTNCHYSKHLYPQLKGQVRATIRAQAAKTTITRIL
jgi:hypothetical protein